MPIVPRSQQTITTRPLNLDVGGLNLSSPPIGVGQREATESIRGFAKTITDFALNEKTKADDSMIMDAFGKFIPATGALLSDPEKGAYNKKGSQVLDSDFISDETKRFDEVARIVGSGLRNRDQITRFNKIISIERAGHIGKLQTHFLTESNTFAEQSKKSAVIAARNSAAENFADPVLRRRRILELQEAIIQRGIETGKPLDQISNEVLIETSKTHVNVIVQMLNNKQFSMARQYLDSITGKPEGLLTPGNIDLSDRPSVLLPSGKRASIISMGIGDNGREILIPTVSDDGKLLSKKEAIALFKKTGKHLGVFSNEKDATDFAKRLSRSQGLRGRGITTDQLTTPDEKVIRDLLKVEGVNNSALFLSRKIITENPNDFRKRRDDLNKIKDPELFSKTRSFLLGMERDAIEAISNEKVILIDKGIRDIKNKMEIIKGNPDDFIGPQTGDPIDLMDINIRENLGHDELNIVRKSINPPEQTTAQEWVRLTEDFYNNRNKYQKMTDLQLLSVTKNLAEKDKLSFVELVRASRSSDDRARLKAGESISTAKFNREGLKGVARSMLGIDPGFGSIKDQGLWEDFVVFSEQQIKEIGVAKGRPINTQEQPEFFRQFARDFVSTRVENKFFGGTKTIIGKKKLFQFTFEDMDEADVNDIIFILRTKRGIKNPNKQQVLDYFQLLQSFSEDPESRIQ